ncbi:MAG: pilus assembly protein TadG-related protein [Candidatus Dormibacteria bacterium]
MTPRPIRNGRRAARGQVMLLFALMAVLLLAIAGLAVDAGMSYFSSDQVERAAASAALAGVAYLPGDFTAAQNAAWVEASRNNFTSNCPGSPCVTVQQPAGTTNQLQVTITVQVPTTFLAVLGFGPHPVTRTATAEFLPPIALGQPGAEQGSVLSSSCNGITSPYCASPPAGANVLGSSGSYYFEREEGWGNPRSEGDAYTPTSLDEAVSCGPAPLVACVASPPDYHQISPMTGSEPYYSSYGGHTLDLDYTGGSSYLITIPVGQSADVQVYNPSFAPDDNDQSNTSYSLHEDDSSFASNSTTASDYSAISYTVFTVPTLSSDAGDTPISQEVFYPFNATCLYMQGSAAQDPDCNTTTDKYYTTGADSYYWFPPTGGGTAATVSVASAPNIYHAWTSVLDTPAGNDSNLFTQTMPYGSDELTDPSTTVPAYYRLEVDTLQWDGTPICQDATCTVPKTGSVGSTNYTTANEQSKAHKGYAVQLAVPGSNTESTTTTMSAMGDMTVYTPIETQGSPASFSIPLFKLDPSYANQTIDVDIFDIGDVNFQSGHAGAAYVGIQEPGGTTFASATMTALGNSLGADGSGNVSPAWGNGACGGAGSACFQTSTSTGTALYNGQWVQLQITVPSTVTDWSDYWSLVYYVSPYAEAGDTFSVQVGFNGSPDRLLP